MSVDRSKWPILVQLSLLGLPNRRSAWAFVWLSVAAAIGSVAWGVLVDPRALVGGAMVLAALAYYGAIRWVDRHGRWS
jgi:hypothetical protein